MRKLMTMNDASIEVLATERQRYVEYFIETIANLKKENETCASELLIEINDSSIREPFNLVRVDFIFKKNNEEDAVAELRLDRNLNYQVVQTTVNNCTLTISPFCWNSVEIIAANLAINELETWIRKWIKADYETEGQLLEVIHSCTFPEFVDGRARFVVDFGTSPVESLIELVNSLTSAGISELAIKTIEV